jgi:hypothetical protein
MLTEIDHHAFDPDGQHARIPASCPLVSRCLSPLGS